MRRQHETSMPTHRRIPPATQRVASSFRGSENDREARPRGSSRTSAFGDDITNVVAGRGVKSASTKVRMHGSGRQPVVAIPEKRAGVMHCGGYPSFPAPTPASSSHLAHCGTQQLLATDSFALLPACTSQPSSCKKEVCRGSMQPRTSATTLRKQPPSGNRDGEADPHVVHATATESSRDAQQRFNHSQTSGRTSTDKVDAAVKVIRACSVPEEPHCRNGGRSRVQLRVQTSATEVNNSTCSNDALSSACPCNSSFEPAAEEEEEEEEEEAEEEPAASNASLSASEDLGPSDLQGEEMDDLKEALAKLQDALTNAESASARVPSNLVRHRLCYHLRQLCCCPHVATIVATLPNSCRDSSGLLVHLDLSHMRSLRDALQRVVGCQVVNMAAVASESQPESGTVSKLAHARCTEPSVTEMAIMNYSWFKGCLPEEVSLAEIRHTWIGAEGWAAMLAGEVEELRVANKEINSEQLQSVLGGIAEYAGDFLDQLFRSEEQYQPLWGYMERQAEINSKMRAILVDWLVEVHLKYRLRKETLFLCVNIIDRFLSKKTVSRRRLQLIGVTALFVAAKFEEIHAPEVRDFVYICDNAYSRDEILNAEVSMLTSLNFGVSCPTVMHFLEPLCKISQCNELQHSMAQYIAELALMELRMIQYSPSQIAAACLLLSNQLLGQEPVWPASAACHARQTEKALTSCVQELLFLLQAAPNMQLGAVRMKYTKVQELASSVASSLSCRKAE